MNSLVKVINVAYRLDDGIRHIIKRVPSMKNIIKYLAFLILLMPFSSAQAELIKGDWVINYYNIYTKDGTALHKQNIEVPNCKILFNDNVLSIVCGKTLVSMLLIDVSTEHLEQSVWPTYSAIDLKTGSKVKFSYLLTPGEHSEFKLEMFYKFVIEYSFTSELYGGTYCMNLLETMEKIKDLEK